MEVIGAVASITGVIGFIGQIAYGCKTIKGFLEDAKHAEKHIERLEDEISFIEETSKTTLQLYRDLETHLGPNQIPDNAICYIEAINALKDKIGASATVFATKAGGAKGSFQRALHRLKYSGNKEGIEQILRWVERTKSQVQLVQHNLIIMLEIAQSTRMNQTNTKLSTILESVNSSAASHSSSISKLQHQILSLEAKPSEIASATSSQVCSDLTPTLHDIKNGSIEALEKLRAEIPFMLQVAIAQALEQGALAHFEKSASAQMAKSTSSEHPTRITNSPDSTTVDPSVEENQHFGPNGASSHMRKSQISRTQSSYRLLGNLVYLQFTTITEGTGNDIEKYTALSHRYSTTVFVQVSLRWLQKGIQVRHQPSTSTFVRGSSIHLKTYAIHAHDSQFAIVARDLDCQGMAKLFSERQASPFDVVLLPRWSICGGERRRCSYIETNLMDILYYRYVSSDFAKAIEWFQFLLQYSEEASQLLGNEILNYLPNAPRNENPSAFYALLKLLLPHFTFDPMEHLRPALQIDDGTEDDPLVRALQTQESWVMELGEYVECNLQIPVWYENSRLMFQDPVGNSLRLAIEKGYTYRFVEPTKVNHFKGSEDSPALRLLDFVRTYSGKNSKEIVEACCSNRLLILISAGLELTELLFWKPRWESQVFQCITLLQYSVQTGMAGFLERVLLRAGMSKAEIHEAFDEDMYHNLPKLMDGDLKFSTVEENRAAFLNELCTGSYFSEEQVPNPDIDSTIKSAYLETSSWAVFWSIIRAHEAYSAGTGVPGSWPVEHVSLVAGKDFSIPWCQEDCDYFETYHVKCQGG